MERICIKRSEERLNMYKLNINFREEDIRLIFNVDMLNKREKGVSMTKIFRVFVYFKLNEMFPT